MGPSQRHKSARPCASGRRVASQMHRPRFKSSQVQGYSHINIQERAPPEDETADPDVEQEAFVRHESLQEEIKEQLLHKPMQANESDTPTRPLTFAEATMSTKRGRGGRKEGSRDSDASLAGPMSLESLGPFKYTFKRKKQNKWSPLNLSAADSASEVGSSSEVGSGSPRPASPNPQPLFSASNLPSPQRPSSTAAIANSPENSRDIRFVEEAEQFSKNILQSPQTPTQKTFNFSVGATVENAEDQRLRQLFAGQLEFQDGEATHQTFNSTTGAIQDKGKGRLIEEDTDRASTKSVFNFADTVFGSDTFHAPTNSLIDTTDLGRVLGKDETTASETESIRTRTSAAMTSIAEAFSNTKASKVGDEEFDPVIWNPDLPPGSVPESPEPLESIVSVPQPLAYTTVGSLVNPNAVPQFTAPNRIQREGAGRRPLMTFMPNRTPVSMRHQEASFFLSRDPSPPLTMQDSMHYAQQISHSPVRLYQGQQSNSAHSSRSTITRSRLSLTEGEAKILERMGGPQMMSGNTQNQTKKLFPSKVPSEVKQPPENISPPKSLTNNPNLTLPTLLSGDLADDGHRKFTALSGLEKMQTIQRLAKFENPMQELARSRLSALSVTNCLGRTVANPSGISTSPSSTTDSVSQNLSATKQGSLDRGYQFPPPGFEFTSISQANPPFRAHASSSLQIPPSNRSGIPQPLTAGPPGQRQYLTSSTSRMNASLPDSRQLIGDMSAVAHVNYWRSSAVDSANQASLQNPHHQAQALHNKLTQDLILETHTAPHSRKAREPVYEGEIVGSKLVDSLPYHAIEKYYPQGLPSNMTGQLVFLSDQEKAKMDLHTPEDRETFRRQELDKWFYGGQREYGKTTTDHINDMAYRENIRRGGGFGPVRPPPTEIIPKIPITPEEMKNMTTAEATQPLLDALFRTLLAYADESTDSESRRHLSRFERPEDFLIDGSEKGNASFFGEDWGAPPKRVDGSNRFKSVFHRPNTTLWE